MNKHLVLPGLGVQSISGLQHPSPFPHFVISLKLDEGFTALKLEIITVDSPHEEQVQSPLVWCCAKAIEA